MKLCSLKMSGFKSFRNSVSIHFDQGITGVVGPNGCGKSNIVDALMWATGAASAGELRGRQMEDIIFAGTSQRPPSLVAEVSLILEKDDGFWPEGFESLSQVELTRKLKRGGDSQYSMNAEPCLLRNIQDFLMGAGACDWSIVEQDKITKLISSKPDEIKAVLEQAAGISSFKSKKKAAQNKLKITLQNLTRVGDILQEQAKHLNRLKRQARAAKSYTEIKNKIRNIEIFLLKNLYQDIEKKIRSKEKAVQVFSGRQNKISEKLKSYKNEHQGLRDKSQDLWDGFEAQKQNLKTSLEKLNNYKTNTQKLKALIESKTKIASQWRLSLSSDQLFQNEKLKKMRALQGEIEKEAASRSGSLLQKLKEVVLILNEWCERFAPKEEVFLKKSKIDEASVDEIKKELKTQESKLILEKQNFEKQNTLQNEMEKTYRDKILSYKNVEDQIEKMNAELGEVTDGKHGLELEIKALLTEKKNLEEKTLENHQTSITSLQPEAEETEEMNESFLNQLKNKLSHIGQVNLLALNEYDEVKKEHEDLKNQMIDLEESRKNLEEAIAQMEKSADEKFKQTFTEVNRYFSEVFQAVFGGGEASLSLTEDHQGLEILACPPGKKLKSLKLLSGGEKSLTALAMVTALFLVRPSPFYVLDEVDSALDDSNIERFNSLMKEISKKCQVILITHNKHSMKECQRLYGATMQEKGVTSLVSVDMNPSLAEDAPLS